MYGDEKEDQWKNNQGVKIEPPQTTKNDRIRFGFFLGAVLLAVILVIFMVVRIFNPNQ